MKTKMRRLMTRTEFALVLPLGLLKKISPLDLELKGDFSLALRFLPFLRTFVFVPFLFLGVVLLVFLFEMKKAL